MTKQYVQNIENCSECPFVVWNYNEFGHVVWECDNPVFDFADEKIIDDPTAIPNWCPLPDKKN